MIYCASVQRPICFSVDLFPAIFENIIYGLLGNSQTHTHTHTWMLGSETIQWLQNKRTNFMKSLHEPKLHKFSLHLFKQTVHIIHRSDNPIQLHIVQLTAQYDCMITAIKLIVRTLPHYEIITILLEYMKYIQNSFLA